jgi:ribosomal protein S27AE
MPSRPHCAKCGLTDFELTTFQPRHQPEKFVAVQCVKCGVPIGVVEHESAAVLVKRLAKALNVRLA